LSFDAGGLIRKEDELSWGIKAVVAKAEREKIARRVRDNLGHLKEGGKLLGHLPLGLRRVRCEHRSKGKPKCRCADNRIVLDPVAQPVVRQVAELYASGRFSYKTLARHLTDEGIPVPVNTDYPKGRTAWSPNLFKGLLQNRALLGEVKVGNEWRKGAHPAVLDEALFDRCQAVRLTNKRRKTEYRARRNVYTLAGLVICARCGGSMHGVRKRSVTKAGTQLDHWYYRCKSRKRGGCDLEYVFAPLLERAIRAELSRLVQSDQASTDALRRLEAGLRKAPNPRKELNARLKALDGQIGRVVEMRETGLITLEQAQERIGKANLAKQAARDELNMLPAVDLAAQEAQLRSLVDLWDSFDASQRHQMVGKVIERTRGRPGGVCHRGGLRAQA
jgi:site-specific DNA recombinase